MQLTALSISKCWIPERNNSAGYPDKRMVLFKTYDLSHQGLQTVVERRRRVRGPKLAKKKKKINMNDSTLKKVANVDFQDVQNIEIISRLSYPRQLLMVLIFGGRNYITQKILHCLWKPQLMFSQWKCSACLQT